MVSRAQRAPFLPQPVAEDDIIDPALLEELPEVEERPPPPFPVAMPDENDVREPEPPPLPTPEQSDLAGLLASLEVETQMLIATQFGRVHESIAMHVADLVVRLGEANATIEQLRDENARLLCQNELYARAFRTFKELTQGVDEQPGR